MVVQWRHHGHDGEFDDHDNPQSRGGVLEGTVLVRVPLLLPDHVLRGSAPRTHVADPRVALLPVEPCAESWNPNQTGCRRKGTGRGDRMGDRSKGLGGRVNLWSDDNRTNTGK